MKQKLEKEIFEWERAAKISESLGKQAIKSTSDEDKIRHIKLTHELLAVIIKAKKTHLADLERIEGLVEKAKGELRTEIWGIGEEGLTGVKMKFQMYNILPTFFDNLKKQIGGEDGSK